MSDNVTITPGTGATIAADEVTIDGASAKVQRVKPAWGVAGSAVDTSASNPMPTADAAVLAAVDGLEAALAATLAQRMVPLTSASSSPISSSTSSVTLQASNTSRRLLLIFNDSTSVLYVKYGSAASSSSYTVKMAAGDYWEMPLPVYTGIVTGVWASANGSALVTEGQ